MDDKELVEVWRSQFESWYRSIYMNSPVDRDSDSYVHAHISSNWATWIAAKRTQQSIVLPKDCHANNSTLFRNGFISALKSVKHELSAAGIKYTIGE